MWIGLKGRDNKESDYKWSDGSVLNYTNWDTNAQRKFSGESVSEIYVKRISFNVLNTGYKENFCHIITKIPAILFVQICRPFLYVKKMKK